MEITLTLIALCICTIIGISWGWQKGFVKCVAGFIATVATMLMLGLFLRIYSAYTQGKTIDLIAAIIILVIFGAIYGMIRFVVKSAKAIAKLPVVFFIDKLLGVILGILVVIVIYHVVVVASRLGMLGQVGAKIWDDVQRSHILTLIAKYDVIELLILLKNKLLNL